MGLNYGSVVKHTWYSFRGPKFDSQHHNQVTQLSGAPAPDLTASSGL